MKQDDLSVLLWVIAGAIVIVAATRYQPQIAGWFLLAVVLAMLGAAQMKGVLPWTR